MKPCTTTSIVGFRNETFATGLRFWITRLPTNCKAPSVAVFEATCVSSFVEHVVRMSQGRRTFRRLWHLWVYVVYYVKAYVTVILIFRFVSMRVMSKVFIHALDPVVGIPVCGLVGCWGPTGFWRHVFRSYLICPPSSRFFFMKRLHLNECPFGRSELFVVVLWLVTLVGNTLGCRLKGEDFQSLSVYSWYFLLRLCRLSLNGYIDCLLLSVRRWDG